MSEVLSKPLQRGISRKEAVCGRFISEASRGEIRISGSDLSGQQIALQSDIQVSRFFSIWARKTSRHLMTRLII
jgi:hypothetical protein